MPLQPKTRHIKKRVTILPFLTKLKKIWQHLANLAAELVLGLEPHKLRLERRALHCFLNFGGVVAEGTTTTLRNLTLSHPLDYEIA